MNDVVQRLNVALDDRYVIERELGVGGMATVYLAEDLKHDRKVAIKVLRPELAAVLGTDRFLAEIRTTAALHHPHILSLYDSGSAGDLLYYVMPFVEGESVAARLQREGALPLPEALHITREVGDALAYAHDRGIVHRDIKPDNVLFAAGHAYVADFGIARALSAAGGTKLTMTGMAVGTPAYMSPEQAAGDDGVDHRSDQYALGCLCYEMIAGRLPFEGANPQELLAKRLTLTAPRLATVRRDVPTAIDAAVHRALARDPADRFESLRAFVSAFDQDAVAAAPADKSIAVLPFTSMSADPDDEFFADGITEEIINVFVNVEGLRVAARTSCFAFKGKHEDLRAVADKLGVGMVLEGSVRKAGARMRITAQLINASDGYHVWSERYDRELTDVFAVQDEIAAAIATRLEAKLAPGTDTASPTANLEAYDLFLKGRALQWMRGPNIVHAAECFEQAVARDPDFAEAHAWLADSYRLHAIYGIAPAKVMMPKARAEAKRALQHDETQVEAFATLANVVACYDLDYEGSMALTDRALALDDRHVRALCEGAMIAACFDGSSDTWARCAADVRRAYEIDPLSAWAAAMKAIVLGIVGAADEAVEAAKASIDIDPKNFTGRWSLAEVLAMAGRHAEALHAAEPALVMSGRHPWALAVSAASHTALGDRAAADAIYQELLSRSKTAYVETALLAATAAAAGRIPEGLDHARASMDAREAFLVYWRRLPAWVAFRADPHGCALLEAYKGAGGRDRDLLS